MPKDSSQKQEGRSRGPRERQDKEFDQRVIDLARVTRVVAGGKRMRFRACVVIGDKKGRVGMAVTKGADVAAAVNKAVTKAKKQLVTVPLVDGTIPHDLKVTYKSARIMMKPAPKGSGVIAGGAVRLVLDLAGIKNVVCKMLGTQNKITNVHAVLKALASFRTVPLYKKAQQKKSS